jgi:uncharacterized protein (DUF302 family)
MQKGGGEMPESNAYCFGKVVDRPYADAVARTRSALQKQGFGILSEINVQAKLKEKLGMEFRPYIILGACNPRLAAQALSAEPNLGVLLPCNVVVYETGKNETTVMAMDPVAALGLVKNPAIVEVAHQVKSLIAEAIQSL